MPSAVRAAGRGGARRRRALAMAPAQALGPAPIEPGRPVAGGLDDRGERQARGRQELRLAAPVVDQLARGVRDADEARAREHRGRAIAQLVVELAPDQQHEVGLAHRRGAHRADHGRVVGRHQAAALPGCRGERAGGSSRRTSSAPAPRAAPGDHQRPLCRPQRVDRFRDRRGMRGQLARPPRLQPLLQHQRRRHLGAQHVGRDLDVDRPGLAEIAARARHRLVELAHDLLGDAQRPGRAGHRPQDVDVGDVLERTHVDLGARRAAADQQHRDARERGVRDRGDGVGHARAGGHHRDPERAGQLGMGMRHVDRGPLVAHVDDADAEPRHVVPDRLDMAALKPEDRSTSRACRKRATQAAQVA